MPLNLHDPDTWIYSELATPSGGPIKYWVLADFDAYHEEFQDNGNLTRVLIAVDWNKRNLFRKYALGFTESKGTNTDEFRRYTPLPNPYQTNQYLVSLKKHRIHIGYAQSPPHQPLPFQTDDTGQNRWFRLPSETNGLPPRIIYDAQFSCFPYEIVNEATFGQNSLKELARYVIREREIRARERRTPSFGYETDNEAATPIPEVGFLPFVDYEFTMTWCRVPLRWVPETAIRECSLKINDAVFDYKARDDAADPPPPWEYGRYKVGDILFKGVAGKIRPYRDPHGQFLVDLPYLFSWQPADGTGDGQLKIPCTVATDSSRWIKVRERGSSASPKYLYGTASLDRLFRPEPT
jgi:hypothetical protein